MKRRRRLFEPTVTHEWEAERDEQLQRYISSGLGIRPELWWLYDSGRPDLAGAGDDTYAHLEPFAGAGRAAERLRWLAANGLLTEAEWTAIRTADPSDSRQPNRQARSWRLDVLTDFGF